MATKKVKQKKQLKGFALMDIDKRRKISSLGGMSQGKHNNPGNFARNKARAAAAGAKGGSAKRKSHG